MKQTTNRISALGFFLGLVLLFSCSQSAGTEAESGVVVAEEVHGLITGQSPPVLIDVRTAMEYNGGHLENAIRIPVQDFAMGTYAKRLEGVSKDDSVIVYCHSGVRSNFAREILIKDGYVNVMDFKGGMVAWRRAKLPIFMGDPTES
ncbi:MAG: rhodanese-like domain-containing protein [Candidatus Hydrogenedentota bacterium]|nr:MAG: rhodanese-like domain-containing protein [Candidatus Hydrogenedentota bacterium]